MLIDDPAFASISELAGAIQQKKASSEEIVRALVDRTKQLDSKLNSYITFLPDQAIEQARKADQLMSKGQHLGKLHGIPISIKDHIDTEGIPTSAGAKSRLNNIPTKDAAVVRRLKNA